jgi:hypothetical protein
MQLQFMENLLRIEAEAKYFLGATDRAYEQELLEELLKITEEAELLFGPRDSSYELLAPRISECSCAYPYVYPSKKIRIYLTAGAQDRSAALYQLAHEAIHALGPTQRWATVLEEGLATWFSDRYMRRVHGLQFGAPNRWYDAARRAVAPLLAENELVVKELRARQPQLSQVDESLLMEIAGIDADQARLLCAEFESSWLIGATWGEHAKGGAQIFVEGFHSIWNQWKLT